MKNHKGFGVVASILLIAVIAIICLIGYITINNSRETGSTTAGNESVESIKQLPTSTTVTEGWEMYKDGNYPFAFAHPEGWVTNTSTFEKGESDDKAVYALIITPPEHKFGGYELRVLESSLSEVVAKELETQREGNAPGVKVTKTKIAKDGRKGVVLTREYDQQEPRGSSKVSTYYFAVDNKVFVFSSVAEVDTMNPSHVAESLQIFDSLKLH